MEKLVVDCRAGRARLVPLTLSELAERAAEAARPAPVPTSVTKLQLVRALRRAGLKASFDTAMSAASAETREDWSLAVSIARADPLVVSFAAALGKSDAEADDLFRLASTL